jgi:hypothetical protein
MSTSSGSSPRERDHNVASAQHSRPSAQGRRCSKSGCHEVAFRTLTFIYADSTAVLGPLATYAEPHAIDLCAAHSQRLTFPQGWTAIVHDSESHAIHEPSSEDLVAIAEAVRQAGRENYQTKVTSTDLGRRGHLRVIPQPE